MTITRASAQRDGWRWLTIDGELHQDTAVELQQRLDRLADSGQARVVLDLAPTVRLDFDALVALVLARARLKRVGGDLLIRAPSTDLSRLLALTGMTGLLEVVEEG
jgi:anti-anti-sigma factor